MVNNIFLTFIHGFRWMSNIIRWSKSMLLRLISSVLGLFAFLRARLNLKVTFRSIFSREKYQENNQYNLNNMNFDTNRNSTLFDLSADKSSVEIGSYSIDNEFNGGFSRTPETETFYAGKMKICYKRSSLCRSNNSKVELSPINIVNDLIESTRIDNAFGKSPIAPSSFVVYHAPLLSYLSNNLHFNSGYETAIEILKDTKKPPGRPATQEINNNILDDDFYKLINALDSLNRKRSKLGSKTLAWFQAGIATRLKCNEWANVGWLADANNILCSYGYGYGYSYSAPHKIVNIKSEDVACIESHISNVEEYRIQMSRIGISKDLAFVQYKKMCQITMRKACKIAFEGRKYYDLTGKFRSI